MWYDIFFQHPTEWLQVLFNAFLSVFTGLLAIYTVKLWISTKNLADGAEKTAKKQLRAYVFVKEIVCTEVKSPNTDQVEKWRVNVIFGNGGNTPTKNLLSNINWQPFAKLQPMPDNFNFPDNPATEPVIGAIAPGQILFSQYVDIPYSFIDHMDRGHQDIYVWGWVNYDDVIDSTSRHRTEFCCKLVKHDNLLSFQPSRKFNGADDECYRAPTPYVRK